MMALIPMGLAVYLVVATASYEGGRDDSLASIGHFFAVLFAAPTLMGALLAGVGLPLRRSRPTVALDPLSSRIADGRMHRVV